MRRNDSSIALLIIVLGIFLLAHNLRLFPPLFFRTWGMIWPLLVIGLGVYLVVWHKRGSSEGRRMDIQVDGDKVRIGDWETQDPVVLRLIGLFVAIVVLGVVAVVLFGVVGPVLVFALGIVGVVVLIALGIPLIALAVPFLVLAAPILLISWLIGLLL